MLFRMIGEINVSRDWFTCVTCTLYKKLYIGVKEKRLGDRFQGSTESCKTNVSTIPRLAYFTWNQSFYYLALYRTIGLWNNLDPFLKSSRSVQVFKRILKNKLLDNFVNTS